MQRDKKQNARRSYGSQPKQNYGGGGGGLKFKRKFGRD